MNIQPLSQTVPMSNGMPARRPAELPHGLISTPQAVLDLVAREEERLRNENQVALPADTKRWMAENFTLQYYYEGVDIAYRRTPQGLEVLAVGIAEIRELAKRLPPEEMQAVITGQP